MNKISEEINELLQEKGSVSISELTNSYELPSDFIQQVRICFVCLSMFYLSILFIQLL